MRNLQILLLFWLFKWREQITIVTAKEYSVVNVDTFGAVGDAVTDDTNAFLEAWNVSCQMRNAVMLVPEERRYLVKASKFNGPCVDKMIMQIDGMIVAPDATEGGTMWLYFSKVDNLVLQGDGVIDGSGSNWWASSCKRNKTNPCRVAPSAIVIDSSNAIKIKGITIQNSPQMHMILHKCNSARISKVQISSPGDSPNTDGIHVSTSSNVVIKDCIIATGDDCVSIVSGSSNIKMKRLYCGPGHGISIGSLGKNNSTDTVANVVLDTAYIKNATNGLRIKTWQGGNGYVRSVRFENVKMENVSNPIIIDQFYCDSPISCKNQTDAVKISQVMYRNISGTSRSSAAIRFACSDTVPCSNIYLANIDLKKEDGEAVTYCNSAQGYGYGVVRPSVDCLVASFPMEDGTSSYSGPRRSNASTVLEEPEGTILHTEL